MAFIQQMLALHTMMFVVFGVGVLVLDAMCDITGDHVMVTL